METEGKNEPQELYALQGPASGEHDPGIPSEYFEVAPAKLSGPGMEAIRVSRILPSFLQPLT